VVVLTGRRDIEERVKCLDLGADDCLLKPFSLKELAARCRAVVRRRSAATDPVLNAGGVEMNRLEHTVRCGGRAVELTGKEYALLEFLMLRAGDCVTRAQLLESVWRMQPEAGTNVVDVYVNYLRKKLSVEGAGGDEVIETVRGSGYRLRAEGPVQACVAVKKAVQSAVPLATVVRVVEAG
jgi:DNA-binding response OmpR family regulator